MKHLTAGLALALLAACGGSQKPKTAAGPTCAAAAANVDQQMVAAGQQAGGDLSPIATIARGVFGERCAADAWSKESIACWAGAKPEGFDACNDQLTPAQRDALEAAMKAGIDAMSDEDKAKMMGGAAEEMAPASAAPPTPGDPCGGDE